MSLPVTDPAYSETKDGEETVLDVQTINITCYDNVTCLGSECDDTTIPANLANISWFDCPDENGNQLFNLSCSGDSTYTDTLTCTRILEVVATCSFWDTELETWSSDGCELLEQVNGTLQCRCTHLTDYVAQFSSIGTNFLATVSYFDDVTLADVLAALPALILFGVIMGIFTVGMVRSYSSHRAKKKQKILDDLADPATAVLFQLALQEHHIARYLVRRAARTDDDALSALVTPEEALMGFSIFLGDASEKRTAHVRELFLLIDDSGDGFLSLSEMYKFVRFMNPRCTEQEVNRIVRLVKFTPNNAGELVITEDEFVSFFTKITQLLDDERFEKNVEFWNSVKDMEAEIKTSLGQAGRDSTNIFSKEAIRWAQAQPEISLPEREAGVPPPMFEPWREQETEADTKEIDELLIAKQLVEHNNNQLNGFRDIWANFVKGMAINHPIINLFSDFTDLHRHQQIMILFLDILSALFVEALLFDYAASGPETEEPTPEEREGSSAESTASDFTETLVFGTLGGFVASFFSIVSVSLFNTAMRKEIQIERFEDQAKRTNTNVEELSIYTPVPKLRHETFIAEARVRIAKKDFKVYEEYEREKGREPLSKTLLVGMLLMNHEHVSELLKGALEMQKTADKREAKARFVEATTGDGSYWSGVKAFVKKVDSNVFKQSICMPSFAFWGWV